jgi:hypothetical protein
VPWGIVSCPICKEKGIDCGGALLNKVATQEAGQHKGQRLIIFCFAAGITGSQPKSSPLASVKRCLDPGRPTGRQMNYEYAGSKFLSAVAASSTI